MKKQNVFFPPISGIVSADVDYSLFTSLSKDNILMIEDDDFKIIPSDSIFFSSGAKIKGSLVNEGIFVIVGGEILIDGGEFKNEGSIFVVKEHAKPLYYTEGIIDIDNDEDYFATGIKMKRDVPDDDDVVISVSGPEGSSVDWQKNFILERGKKEETEFYFSSDGGETAKTNIEKNDELYFNSFFSNTPLHKHWKILVLF